MKLLTAFLLLVSIVPAAAQTTPAKTPASDADSAAQPELPAISIQFSDPKPFVGAPSLQAWTLPILCAGDGTIMISAPATNMDWHMPDFYAISTEGSHKLDPRSASGIYDMQYHGAYFASDSMYGIEVTGTPDSKQEMRTFRPDKPAQQFYTGKHHEYILEFDRDGSYKKTVELPDQYTFWRIAPLPDDTFVAVAYDRVNAVPRLLLLDSSGSILHPIQIPQSMEDDPALKQGQSSDRMKQMKAESSLSWWLFAPARGKVLLYKARAHASVLEIGPGGATREVPLQSPRGYELSSVVPSTDRWIMQFRRTGLNDKGRAVDVRPQTGNIVYYEMDPNDGSLMRRIDLPPGPLQQIACEDNGSIQAFTVDHGAWLEISADLPR